MRWWREQGGVAGPWCCANLTGNCVPSETVPRRRPACTLVCSWVTASAMRAGDAAAELCASAVNGRQAWGAMVQCRLFGGVRHTLAQANDEAIPTRDHPVRAEAKRTRCEHDTGME
jgi:hypothetical protein